MLMRAGRGLTSAFIYTEALPENVISARLRWRQGDGAWHEMDDDIYPYEFSPELRDDAGDFECVFEIEDVRQKIQRSPVITLSLADGAQPDREAVRIPAGASRDADTPVRDVSRSGNVESKIRAASATPRTGVSALQDLPPLSDDFLAYLQRAANAHNFGLRADGRFYPYSTPQGRRIAWRQPVWDKSLFARGCTRAE